MTCMCIPPIVKQYVMVIMSCMFGSSNRWSTLLSFCNSYFFCLATILLIIWVGVGGIPLPIFSEWWLAKEKFSVIDSFILSSFPGVTFQGCNGLSAKYQVKSILTLGYLIHIAIQIILLLLVKWQGYLFTSFNQVKYAFEIWWLVVA